MCIHRWETWGSAAALHQGRDLNDLCTNLGGYTHDPTHVTRVHDPIRRLMGADYVIRGHRVAVSDMWG